MTLAVLSTVMREIRVRACCHEGSKSERVGDDLGGTQHCDLLELTFLWQRDGVRNNHLLHRRLPDTVDGGPAQHPMHRRRKDAPRDPLAPTWPHPRLTSLLVRRP